MAKKKRNDDWLLLLLLLGLSGLRGISGGGTDTTPFRPRDPTPTGMPPATDGNPATPTPNDKTGMMDKAKQYIVNFMDNVGVTASKVLDKSTNISPPNTTPEIPSYTPNAGVLYAENQIKLINSQNVAAMQNGLNLIPHLGDPTHSITTVLFDPASGTYKTYTNNELLFNTTPTNKNNPTQPPASPIYPPSSNPPTPRRPQLFAVDTTGGFGENVIQSASIATNRVKTPPELVGLVDPNTLVNHRTNVYQTYSQPAMIQQPQRPVSTPSLQQLNQMTKILNPLVNPSNPLANLQSFGQAELNALLAAGQNLFGAFNNLQSIFPFAGTPINAPRPLIFEGF